MFLTSPGACKWAAAGISMLICQSSQARFAQSLRDLNPATWFLHRHCMKPKYPMDDKPTCCACRWSPPPLSRNLQCPGSSQQLQMLSHLMMRIACAASTQVKATGNCNRRLFCTRQLVDVHCLDSVKAESQLAFIAVILPKRLSRCNCLLRRRHGGS
jgi:hypothetical protein